MKLLFFKKDHNGLGGRFENTTSKPSDGSPHLLTLPKTTDGTYPDQDIILGSSEQMFHFLKVVDYVNEQLRTLGQDVKEELFALANELYSKMSEKNASVFLPRDDWDPLLQEFAKKITTSNTGKLNPLKSALSQTNSHIDKKGEFRIDWAWSTAAHAGKNDNDTDANYQRMVTALKLKMAGDPKFQQDVKYCLENGIFPAECSQYDNTWGTGYIDKNGNIVFGKGLLGPAILEAGVKYFEEQKNQ